MKFNLKIYFSFFFFLSLFLLNSCNKKETEYQALYKQAKTLSKEMNDIPSMEIAIKKYEELIAYTMMALDGKYYGLKVMGIELIEQRKYLKAIEIFEKMKQIKPEEAVPYYYLGLCYGNYVNLNNHNIQGVKSNLKEVTLAEQNLLTAQKLSKGDMSVDFALGILYGFVKNNIELGLEYLEIANEKKPKDTQTLFALANLHVQQNEKERAIALYREIIDLSNSKSKTKVLQKAQKNIDELQDD